MARDKSHPDRPLEEGEMLDGEGQRILSAAFVAHIGKGFSPEDRAKSHRKRPLTKELEEIAAEHPELKRLLAIRLWKMALLGRGSNALDAMRLIFERMEGPVRVEKSQEIGQVTVIQQSYQVPQPFEAIPTDAEVKPQIEVAGNRLRNSTRDVPRATETLSNLEDDGS
jgi:hypothetical protein